MQMNVKIEKIGNLWKIFKIETYFGSTFKTLIGQGRPRKKPAETQEFSDES